MSTDPISEVWLTSSPVDSFETIGSSIATFKDITTLRVRTVNRLLCYYIT